jgi:hypothetical protein
MGSETFDALRASVAEGLVEVVGNGNGNGQLSLRVTEAGLERAVGIVDAALEGYGPEAARALALILGLRHDVAEQLVALRREQLDET